MPFKLLDEKAEWTHRPWGLTRDITNPDIISDEADPQLSPKPAGNLLKRVHRGVPVSVLEPTEVRLFETAALQVTSRASFF